MSFITIFKHIALLLKNTISALMDVALWCYKWMGFGLSMGISGCKWFKKQSIMTKQSTGLKRFP